MNDGRRDWCRESGEREVEGKRGGGKERESEGEKV